MGIEKHPFGQTPDRTRVDIYKLTNANGMEARITNYGATLVSLSTCDREEKPADVVLGYDSLKDYIEGKYYFGCIVGRYANRIAGGRFRLNDSECILARNEGENHLHGGITGFDKVVWQARENVEQNGVGLALSYLSKDGEEGYPGNLSVTVIYTLTDQNELRIDYNAVADKVTVINLTNHSYFNLAGAGSGDILDHVLMIPAGRFTPTDGQLIPTGELKSVEGTPMDFTSARRIGSRIGQNDDQLRLAKGYDQNWVLSKTGDAIDLAARVVDPDSGRVMEAFTTQPGIQFYAGNFLDDQIQGKGGRQYHHRSGFCLETQHFPDSPNQPDFPSTVLEPGVKYEHTTIYRFSAE